MLTRLSLCFCLLGLHSASVAEIYRVDDAAALGGDGLSWASPFKTIQEAIDKASSDGGGEVWVSEGIYTGAGGNAMVDSNSAGECVVVLAEHVHLYGGFSGVESERGQRDWNENSTAIDGENVRRGVGGEKNSTLDGFTVTRGRALGAAPYNSHGGGIFNFGDSVNIANCTFENNIAKYGGGIYNHYASPTITNCMILNNHSQNYGGGLDNLTTSSPVVLNCLFAGNSSGISGGALNNHNVSNPVYINCTIVNNTAEVAGSAVHNTSGSLPVFKNCILWNSGTEIYNTDTESVTTLTYSCIRGGYSGEGNISLNPLFDSSGTNGAYSLLPTSPCIDLGTSDGAPVTDILGVSRPQGLGVDMGAYEFIDYAPVASCRDLFVHLDETGSATISPLNVNNGSSDDRGVTGLRLSQSSFSCADIGNHSIVLTVEDDAGQTDSCSSLVTVLDTIAPVIELDGESEVSLEVGGSYTELGATATDACTGDLSIIIGGDAVDTEIYGVYQVTYDTTDSSGNDAATQVRTVSVSPAWRAVWYVDSQSASGTPDGSSWGTAFQTIQSAIDTVALSGASESTPSEIWVAADTYTGVGGITSVSGNPAGESVVLLAEGIHLYGGFSGSETMKSQRDWSLNPTIIDGEDTRRCVTGDNFAILDGFTITHGLATGSEEYGKQGGGIFNFAVSPEIANCIVQDNLATYGGGIYNHYAASPAITNCIVLDNEATLHAGGIDNITNSSPVIINCVIAGNIAGGKGGGLSNDNYSSPVIINSTITGNSAGDSGGAIYNLRNSSPVITNCIFWSNGSGIQNSTNSVPQIQYSCVQNGYSGVGNTSLNPLFLDTDSNNYTLMVNSPCIDTGTLNGAPEYDLLMVSRPQRNGIDMGAYEYASSLPTAVCHDIILNLDSSGNATITPEDIDAGSSDDEFLASMELSQYSFDCGDLGDNSVQLTVRDNDGNTDSCTATVTVVDVTAPTVTINGQSTVTLGFGETYVERGVYASDSCDDDPEVTISGHEVDNGVLGTYYVYYNVVDASGNAAATLTRTVNVEASWHQIWYVDAASQDTTPNGLSWETAYSSIQVAINTAVQNGASESTPSDIWVREGTYTGIGGRPTINDEDVGQCVVMMAEGILLKGGFAGTETDALQRDWAAHNTTIDGQEIRRCVFGAKETTLDGFYLINGRATGSVGYTNRGGGMLVFGADPRINNCTFRDNEGYYGGALYNHYASPTIYNCIFESNISFNHGGAINNVTTSSPTIMNCLFTNNRAVNSAGGIYNVNLSAPVVVNSIFAGNTATTGGAFRNHESSPTLINCTLWGNDAIAGGALLNFNASPTVTNSIIWSNGDNGVNNENSSPTMTYTCIQGGHDGEGNIDGDPLLADPENGYFSLSLLSPCIDAGTVDGTPDEDFLRKPRHVGASVDMGAIEFAPKTGWFIY
jgi:surface protein with Ig-like domain/parallel beta helix pectate lyase-like protein/polymorphic membrane protein